MAVFDTFIGLEVHIHLLTRSKVFCSCPSIYGAEPNSHVCPVCLGYPGVLPAINREALRFSYMVGTALHCTLSQKTAFERKNYFYPDMAKNYQISQFADPVGTEGWFEFETGSTVKRVGIHDIHLEEDAGKMIHDGEKTLIDYNRAGTALLEIVTEPHFTSGQEAEDFLQAFRRLVRYLEVCDGNMEEGSLRCDANISINRKGKGLGTKVEIKNLNSSRNVRRALRYEQKRQARAMKTGAGIVQETRLWDDQKQKTTSMRTKEAASDYRYFPEPDIPPFIPDAQFLKDVEAGMRELPFARKLRLQHQYGLSEEMAGYISDERARADFFEEALSLGAAAGESAKWIKGEVARALGQRGLSLKSGVLSSQRFSSLMKLLSGGTIHANIAREILEAILDEDRDPETIVEQRGLTVSRRDESQLEELVEAVLAAHPTAVTQIRDGDQKVIGFLMGQVMQKTGRSADPAAVRRKLIDTIAGRGNSPTRSDG